MGKVKVTIDNDIEFATPGAAANIKTLTSVAAKQATATDTNTGITVSSTKAGVNTHKLTINNTTTEATGAKALVSGDATLALEAGKSYTSSDINKMLADAGVEMRMDFDGSKTGAEIYAGKSAAADHTFTLGDTVAGAGLSAGGGIELQIGDTNDAWNQLELSIDDMHVSSLGIGDIDISTRPGASAAISKIKDAINQVSTSRGKLGAIQNRLEHTINNLGVTTENITAAESRIRDVDMAKEMMEFTKNSVLMQSAQAMLAQANQQPQSILQLLQ